MKTDAVASRFPRVAVVGAGVVGTVAALALARRGCAVTLIERAPPPAAPAAVKDDRSVADWPIRHVALGADSVALLSSLGVEQFVHGRFDRISVWEALGTASLEFTAAEAGLECLGWMAELPSLTAVLWQAAQAESRIDVRAGVVLRHLHAPDARGTVRRPVQLELATATTVDAPSAAPSVLDVDFVLAADGARSWVREQLAVPTRAADTGHYALATVAQMARPHDRVARQIFLPGGPLALLPTQHPCGVSVVWSQSQADAKRRSALEPADLGRELEAASGSVLGQVLATGESGCFPIQQQLAETFLPHPRVALVGDAARTVHPLAGLGVNLGIDDVQTLLAALAGLLPPPLALRRWSRRRWARSQIVQRLLSTLQTTYGAQGPRITLLRNAGVRTVAASGLLRQLFIHEALGADRAR
ncbi:MAG: FAD-dependent oxidoreductase [Pseudomonadota bacterium]